MKSILIIGAGFSGAVTAVQLLRQDTEDKIRVILVNRSGSMARGIAYGTRSTDHLLNVPAGNMSALADDPDHFLRFCRRFDPHIPPSSFVSRRIYGDYLESLLSEVEQSDPDRKSLTRLVGEVTHIALGNGRKNATVTLSDGLKLEVDQVVLAFGHYQPKDPKVATPAFYRSARYVKDPWAPSALAGLAPDEPVLLLGTGLTAVDVAANLAAQGGSRVIHAVSRRGLLPQPHRTGLTHFPHGSLPAFSAEDIQCMRRQLRVIRMHIRDFARAGGDWREVIGALRPITQKLWRQLPERGKKQFLRHVQPFWDIHRHRVAPESYAQFEKSIQSGALKVMAGRIACYEEHESGVAVAVQPRGGKPAVSLNVGCVINCTGPGSDLHAVDDPVVRQMLDDGMIQADALGLGLQVAEDCAVVDRHGNASDVLYYIGPLLKAHYWEATAVPELRVFADRLAKRVIGKR